MDSMAFWVLIQGSDVSFQFYSVQQKKQAMFCLFFQERNRSSEARSPFSLKSVVFDQKYFLLAFN